VLLTTHPLLVPWSWKSRAIPLPTLWATTERIRGTLYLYFTFFQAKIEAKVYSPFFYLFYFACIANSKTRVEFREVFLSGKEVPRKEKFKRYCHRLIQ